MASPQQPVLIEIPEQPFVERPAAVLGALKFKRVDRSQMTWQQLDVDSLIAPDHKARAIWELAGRMDLTAFTAALKTRKGQAGREAWDPQLLVSLWVYAYSEGISSARQIAREMEWEPGSRWLSGLKTVNHHTLSDFRVQHKVALDQLFADLLGLLERAGCLSLERVMHDGTKIRAQAGVDTFRREPTVQEHLARARAVVEQMGDPRADPSEAQGRSRKQAAQERAARERKERLERAAQEIQALQQDKQTEKKQPAEPDKQTEKEKPAVRVSMTEPEARMMKHGDNAIAPSYNAQISTDAKEKIIVGVHLSQCSSDAQSLPPALDEVKANLGRLPQQVVVDGGFTNRATIVTCAAQGIDLIGSLPDTAGRTASVLKRAGIDPEFAPDHFEREPDGTGLRCPGGCRLELRQHTKKRDNQYGQYRARGEDCTGCQFQKKCCPKHPEQGRAVLILIEERAEASAFRAKMETPEAQAIYKQRGPVAEFPNAWIKEKCGLRKFSVWGKAKAGMELLWACLTYNVMQWSRLCWRPQFECFTGR